LKPDYCVKGKFPLMKGNFESKKSDNLFFAGTITHILDLYSAASGFIHGFRYNSVILAKYLAFKNHGTPLPSV
jgi:folate-dependent tRNA-U54 methylase TrmFO/GidA